MAQNEGMDWTEQNIEEWTSAAGIQAHCQIIYTSYGGKYLWRTGGAIDSPFSTKNLSPLSSFLSFLKITDSNLP